MNDSFLQEPALTPPPGVVPNFADPGGSQSIGYGIVITTSIISVSAVFARLLSSALNKKFVPEDFLLLAALGVFAGNQYITYDLVIYPGVWAHQWNITNEFFIHFLYNIHLGAVFYGPTAMFIKVAILVNWLRIFVPARQRNATFWILHTLLWVNVVYYVVTTLTEIFRCSPREKIWNPWFEGGSCRVDVAGQNIATSILNFISDTTILAMPQWIIWHLHTSRARKWGLSLLFVIGVGAWTFGVIRTVYFVKLLHSEDVTYNMSGVAIWTIWEVTTGFLIMGIPAFPGIAKKLPVSESVVSLFRSWRSRKESNNTPEAKPSPQWNGYVRYKPKPQKIRGQWDISELETQNAGDDVEFTASDETVDITKGSVHVSEVRTATG